jgi:hypothetical protein
MKLPRILASFLIISASLGLMAASDAFGTSEPELAALKKMNQTNPTVSESDLEIAAIMVGKWTTGRHDYIFRKDGTWQMLPITEGGTAGKWHIKGGRLFDGNPPSMQFLKVTQDLLILKNDSGVYPFRYVRIK